MKIELKNLRIYNRMSEETIAFTADVYVNGKKVAYAKNDGQGGCTFYHPYPDADSALLGAAEVYCKGLPPKKVELGSGIVDLPQSLESVIDTWVYRVDKEKAEQKHDKQLAKNMLKGVCYGSRESYKTLSWKGWTLPDLLKNDRGREIVKAKLLELTAKGQNILNTNIPKELFG